MSDSAAGMRCRLCGSKPCLGGPDPAFTPFPRESDGAMLSQCADRNGCQFMFVTWHQRQELWIAMNAPKASFGAPPDLCPFCGQTWRGMTRAGLGWATACCSVARSDALRWFNSQTDALLSTGATG